MKLIILISFSLLIASCDLFNTRTAETPNQPRTNFQQAITPDLLIENLVNSLHDKSVENYLSCLSDSSFTNKGFVFSPSSGALSQFPSLAGNWTEKNEEQYFNNLKVKVPDNLPVTLTLTNESYSPQGDSVIYTASYFLSVPTQDPNLPQSYQGDLRFNIVRDSRAIWSIYYWQDSKNSQLPSWSELKGRMNY